MLFSKIVDFRLFFDLTNRHPHSIFQDLNGCICQRDLSGGFEYLAPSFEPPPPKR